MFGSVTAIFCTLFWVNFWLAAKHLGVRRASTDAALNNQRQLRRFQIGSRIVYIPLSLLLAVIVALPLYLHWESALFYFFGFDANVADPTFGKDISFYLFSLPVYLLVMRSLLLVFGILLLTLTVLYWLEKRVLSKSGQRLPVGARVHLSVLVLLVFCIAAGDFFLQRYELLYVTPHLPLFYGPGYVEMNITLPLIWAASLLLLGFAVALVTVINARKGWLPLIICALLFAIVLPGRYFTSVLAKPFYKYIVKPDELAKESPYIENSIEATLAAYGLDQVESRDYPIKDLPWNSASPQLQLIANSIPV